MKIVLRPHLKIRLKQRKIPQTYPKIVIQEFESKYLDTKTNHYIAVKNLEYGEKIRPMVVAYDIIDLTIQVITVYPTSEKEISNRIKIERWLKND